MRANIIGKPKGVKVGDYVLCRHHKDPKEVIRVSKNGVQLEAGIYDLNGDKVITEFLFLFHNEYEPVRLKRTSELTTFDKLMGYVSLAIPAALLAERLYKVGHYPNVIKILRRHYKAMEIKFLRK